MELEQIANMSDVELRAYIEKLEDEKQSLEITNEGLKQALEVIAGDFKVTKDAVMKIVGMIGLLDKNGDLKESIDYKQMLSTVTGIMWMTDAKRAEQFGFIAALVPIIIKYKDI